MPTAATGGDRCDYRLHLTRQRVGEKSMKVVIAGVFPSTAREKTIDTFPSDWDVAFLRPEDAESEIGTADVLILEHIQVNAALLEKAPALKFVQTGAGYNNVNLDVCTRYGVKVCNSAGVNANAVAEHVLACILCWYKNLIYLAGFTKAHRDKSGLNYTGSELAGKTIGLIGLGHIGQRIAALCRAFDMQVLGYSRSVQEVPGVERARPWSLWQRKPRRLRDKRNNCGRVYYVWNRIASTIHLRTYEVISMAKTAAISMRVEPELKSEAESVFGSLGLSLTEAINVFLHMSVIEGGLPFEVKQPRYNVETERAIDEARNIMAGRINTPAYESASELFSAIDE